MKKLELIQLEELDANFIIIYENDRIDYANFFMGINHNAVSEISKFIDYTDLRFYKIFGYIYYEFNQDLETALEQAWDLHCSLFLGMEDTIPRLSHNSTKDEVIKYLDWLAKSDYIYHIDDSPEDIIWKGVRMTQNLLQVLTTNSEILWKRARKLRFDPWDYYNFIQ